MTIEDKAAAYAADIFPTALKAYEHDPWPVFIDLFKQTYLAGGVEALAEQWTKVDPNKAETLPDEGKVVLCRVHEGDFTAFITAMFLGVDICELGDEELKEAQWSLMLGKEEIESVGNTVTHWMEIPEPNLQE